MKKKILLASIIALSVALLVAVGSSIAYLISTTEEVVNTFSPTDVSITLKERRYYPDTNSYSEHPENNVTNSYPMVPGTTYGKDPVVTVEGKANAIDCYLFVKIIEANDAKEYLTYELKVDDWRVYSTTTEGETTTTIWVREVTASTSDQSWYLLKGKDTHVNGYITVNSDTVTKESMGDATLASLTFDAEAVQKANLTVDAAYAQLSWNTTPSQP